MLNVTVEKVVMKLGMVVYYLECSELSVTLRSHMVQSTPIGPSINRVVAFNNKIFYLEKNAGRYRDYIISKMVKARMAKTKGDPLLPNGRYCPINEV